jgi:hypothetical protein
MSPELDTLDQLVAGKTLLSVIRQIYPDDQHFCKSVYAMLLGGDVLLQNEHNDPVPEWRWRELFIDGAWLSQHSQLWLDLTDQGARRVA